ncbi:phosphatidate cytidylyltransferase [Phascolarctobacterium sp.]|uniref:phosphatidate cytidylyltransferase n=1 Tax=Phascolarctobacterium sp. TaxID=2049039 RepID=UPI00386DF605
MLTRIITGLVGIAAAIGIITKGGLVFAAAVFLLAAIGWYEYHKMAASKDYHVYPLTSGLGSVLIVGMAALGYYVEMEQVFTLAFMVMLTALFFIFNAIEGLWRHCNRGDDKWLANTALSAWAMLYCGLLFAHVILLRSFDGGPHIDLGFRVFEYGEICLWVVLLGTWASDTFAYFFGRAFGKTPFCSVSPKKSFEGAVSGFVGCFIVVMALGILYLGLPLWQAVFLGAAVAVFAPLGDLIESIIKRSFEIKDSGNIFPGHGGVLDRFDSLLFTAPVVYYVLMIISIFSFYQF